MSDKKETTHLPIEAPVRVENLSLAGICKAFNESLGNLFAFLIQEGCDISAIDLNAIGVVMEKRWGDNRREEKEWDLCITINPMEEGWYDEDDNDEE